MQDLSHVEIKKTYLLRYTLYKRLYCSPKYMYYLNHTFFAHLQFFMCSLRAKQICRTLKALSWSPFSKMFFYNVNTSKLVQCTRIQAPSQEFLRAVEVCWNQVTLINTGSPTHDSNIRLPDTLKNTT